MGQPIKDRRDLPLFGLREHIRLVLRFVPVQGCGSGTCQAACWAGSSPSSIGDTFLPPRLLQPPLRPLLGNIASGGHRPLVDSRAQRYRAVPAAGLRSPNLSRVRPSQSSVRGCTEDPFPEPGLPGCVDTLSRAGAESRWSGIGGYLPALAHAFAQGRRYATRRS